MAGLADDGDQVAGPDAGLQGRPNPRGEALVAELKCLSADLLAHLQYEEENISGTLRTLPGWPGW
jgi:hypothetical protein